jgi:two-component system, sensor histidine kinase YesM
MTSRLHIPALPSLPLFAKIFLAFVLVVVPIYLVSFFLYQTGIEAVRERLLEAEAQQARVGLQNLEREVLRVQDVMLHFTDNYQLRKLALESTVNLGWDNVEAIRTLQGSLFILSAMSPLVETCSVWLPYMGRVITPLDVLPRPGLGGRGLSVKSGILSQGDGFSLDLAYPANHETSGLQFLVSTSFTGNKLRDYLATIARFPGGSAFMAVGPERTLIGDSVTAELRETVGAARAVRAANGENPRNQFRRTIGGRTSLVTYIESERFDLAILLVTPEDKVLGPLVYLSTWFVFLTVLTLVLILIFALWLTAFIERPLHTLIDGLTRVEGGDLKVSLTTVRQDEFGFLYSHFDRMVASLDSTMTRLVEQETLVRQAELKQLQYQINPHFLYNSIYHIYRMARAEDYEGITDYSLHLGSYFEFVTRSGDDMTSLGEEVNHARNYMEIQRTRFSGRIVPEIRDPSPRAAAIRVPRLILQPLLENAYNHGLADKSAEGRLRLLFGEEEGRVSVLVEDNGDGLDDETLEGIRRSLRAADEGATVSFTGLINIHRRLTLQFGPSSSLSVGRSALGGFAVGFTIPFPD